MPVINPRTLAAGGLLAALTAVVALTVRKDGYVSDPVGLAWWYAACWALFAVAVFAVRKVPARQAAVLIAAGGVAVAATGLLAPPRTSTDSFRYAWDGRVQAAGISPYDHPPAAPELVKLRDDWLFPAGDACGLPERVRIPGPKGEPHCTRMNRPQVHTIYPPVAEGYFLLVHGLSPDGSRHKGLQIGGVALSAGVTAVLLLVLRRRGDPRLAALWAWCPIVPIEAVNNAHVDVLGVLLAVAGLALVAQRRRGAGGALLGAAVAAKLMPAVVLPGALAGVRRVRDAAAVLGPAAAVTAFAYLPYLLVSNSSVLGYLGGYTEEEGYDDPSARQRYALLRLVLPDDWALPALVAGVLAVVAHVLLRGDPERPWSGALAVTGAAFLLATPGYSWYALLLAALVALDGRWEWLAVAAAGAAKYVTGNSDADAQVMSATAYGVAAGIVLAAGVARRAGRARRQARAGGAAGDGERAELSSAGSTAR
ncbi:glycosyltransferase family 87 protein [Streptomyces sp. HNM0663]|uniref:Glycosyltransferase family 87 protein n=1 Tax=Streptomyces chengmaiensis TaxID=3040919 RepID=A0ABT6HXM1_9ACTN|nr:glycosyltransferase family 87 protein [Streptomyces chengmaiensis]MDH2392814.1 glycosyltransferase family 87 protein [Streptomyces chengmaiensis]